MAVLKQDGCRIGLHWGEFAATRLASELSEGLLSYVRVISA